MTYIEESLMSNFMCGETNLGIGPYELMHKITGYYIETMDA